MDYYQYNESLFVLFKEKTLLRTHHYLRSVDDRKKLVNLLASLMCFSRIPPVSYRLNLPSYFQMIYVQIYSSESTS